MRAASRLLGLLVASALAFPAAADHCTAPWSGTDGSDVDLGAVYLVQDNCEPECGGFRVFLYAETNDFPGLQRGDDWEDTTCHGMVPPDTILL